MGKLVEAAYYWVVSLILTGTLGLFLPFIIYYVSTAIGLEGDLTKGLSCTYLSVVFIFCLLLPHIPRGRLNSKGKAIFITGCDTGFGLIAAKKFDAMGMHVFAGCYLKDKGGEGAKLLQDTGSERLKVIQLDVSSDESVKDAVDFIGKNLPAGQTGLWGVINNAGTSAFGDIEWSSMELYKHVADVNLWGVVRVTKACLPLIRRAKGRVVNMASGISRMAAPSRSVYCITKFGVQAFSDCLRYEMKQWGVKVSILEPGNYIAGTSIFTKESVSALADKMWSQMNDTVKKDYGRTYFNKKVNEMVGYCNAGTTDLSPVINAYEDALLSKNPSTRYFPMSPYWKIKVFIMTHFPTAIADYIYITRGSSTVAPTKYD